MLTYAGQQALDRADKLALAPYEHLRRVQKGFFPDTDHHWDLGTGMDVEAEGEGEEGEERVGEEGEEEEA